MKGERKRILYLREIVPASLFRLVKRGFLGYIILGVDGDLAKIEKKWCWKVTFRFVRREDMEFGQDLRLYPDVGLAEKIRLLWYYWRSQEAPLNASQISNDLTVSK